MKTKNINYSIVNIQWKRRFGFTMVELMVTILIAMLVFAGIGVAIVDSIKSFPKMYERTTGNYDGSGGAGIIPDSYVAKAAFDRICRRASIKKFLPDTADTTPSDWIEVYYYNDVNSPSLDRYARLWVDGNDLKVDHGTYVESTGSTSFTSTETLAITVDTGNLPKFAVQAASVTMALSLKKGNQAMTVTSTAVRHNE
ncbi:MAG: prepilin-type N-terminal cleavage/methylation domain-containing protein [Candidatus Saccharibacteria bacterium]|nr:prepilin-type N-terminal cleavage/methylation domain-containing protein [Candidatus Saccharibacteria bacterium]